MSANIKSPSQTGVSGRLRGSGRDAGGKMEKGSTPTASSDFELAPNAGGKMGKGAAVSLVSTERIESKIFLIRGRKIMLDRDLAILYGVETKYLKRQVRRNLDRFPQDFMFKLTREEFKNWRCQFVTSNSADKMGLRYPPYAFTEPGVAMLSSVLNSNRAIQVNIQIIRTFIKLREMLLTHRELKRKIEAMERKYDQQFKVVFEAIRKLLEPPPDKERRIIGFQTHTRKD